MNSFKKFFSQSRNLLFKSQESFAYIALGMSLLILITKISGIFKLQVLVRLYGLKSINYTVFNAANIIPEFIFLIVAIGGINGALIPVLSQASVNEDELRIKKIFSSLVNIFFLFLLFVSILVFIFARNIVTPVLNLDLTSSPTHLGKEEIDLFVRLLRIIIFSPILLSISSIFSSILQIKRRFLVTQLAPLFYNFGVIICAVLFVDKTTQNVEPLAWGVVLGSLLHFLIQVPAILDSKIRYSPFIVNLRDGYVRKALKQSLPRTIGLTSDYVGNIFQTLIALRLPEVASLNAFKYALSLRDIPITMFGVAISTALFPSLSMLNKDSERGEFQILFSKGLRAILFWTLPAAVLFMVLRTPLVRFLFSIFSDSITLSDASLISYCLFFFSFGTIFYSILNLVNRAYYSLNDSKTPTIVSVSVIIIELALTYVLVNLFSHFPSLSINPANFFKDSQDFLTIGSSSAAIGGIALASSISMMINLIVLVILLKKKKVYFFYESSFIYKKVISSFVMLVGGLISLKVLGWYFVDEKIIGVFFLTLNTAIIMLLIFYVSEKLLKDDDIKFLHKPISKFKKTLNRFKSLFKGLSLPGIGA